MKELLCEGRCFTCVGRHLVMCKEPLYMHKVPMCKGHLLYCKYYHLVLNWYWTKIVPIQQMDQPVQNLLKSPAKYQILKFQFSKVVEEFKLNVEVQKKKPLNLWGFSFFGGFVQLSKLVRKKTIRAGKSNEIYNPSLLVFGLGVWKVGVWAGCQTKLVCNVNKGLRLHVFTLNNCVGLYDC